MALTVPVKISNDAGAMFTDSGGGELAFNLKVSIPIVKLVEALLRYQNHVHEAVGEWEALPPPAAPLVETSGRDKQMPAAIHDFDNKSYFNKNSGDNKIPASKVLAAKVAPALGNANADDVAMGKQPVILNGAAWDTLLPTPAQFLPHFPESFRPEMRWHRGPGGLVAWNGALLYDPPLVTDETLLNKMQPRTLSAKPLPQKMPSVSPEHWGIGMASRNGNSESNDERPSFTTGITEFGRYFFGTSQISEKAETSD